MSEPMFWMESDVFLAAADQPAALAAAQALPHEPYAWTDADWWMAPTLAELLQTWEWDGEFDGAGNLIGVEYLGDRTGDELVLFQAIAPFVKVGSYIQLHDDYGGQYRYVFDGQTVHEVRPELVWPAVPLAIPEPPVVACTFRPQGWVEGYLIDLDPPEDARFSVPVGALYDASGYLIMGYVRDELRRFAPAWAQQWAGPFEIEINAPERRSDLLTTRAEWRPA